MHNKAIKKCCCIFTRNKYYGKMNALCVPIGWWYSIFEKSNEYFIGKRTRTYFNFFVVVSILLFEVPSIKPLTDGYNNFNIWFCCYSEPKCFQQIVFFHIGKSFLTPFPYGKLLLHVHLAPTEESFYLMGYLCDSYEANLHYLHL